MIPPVLEEIILLVIFFLVLLFSGLSMSYNAFTRLRIDPTQNRAPRLFALFLYSIGLGFFVISMTDPEGYKESILASGMVWFLILFLIVLGFYANIRRSEPRGEKAIRRMIHRWGGIMVVFLWIVSLALILTQRRIGGFDESDLLLNTGLPFLNFKRNIGWEIISFFLVILGYPIAFLIGVRIGRSSIKPKPAVHEPIELASDKSIIVFADTHIGLRPDLSLKFSRHGSKWEPEILASFLNWLNDLSKEDVHAQSEEDERFKYPYWKMPANEGDKKGKKDGTVEHKRILPPEYVVMLGDIVEMWDGTEESVQLAISTIFPKLQDINSKLIFIVGNHDNLYEREETNPSLISLAENEGDMVIVPEVWPGAHVKKEVDDPDDMRPIIAGKREYLFIHGHQFDRSFHTLGPLAFIPGHLRRAARLGHYNLIFLFLLSFMLYIRYHIPDQDALVFLIIIILSVLALPIIYMAIGRLLWDSMVSFGKGIKNILCGRKRVPGGFRLWWKLRAGNGRAGTDTKPDNSNLTVVYGHTHITDIFKPPKDDKSIELPLLLNLPSWIFDVRHPNERPAFLYIDNHGPLFLGWDWEQKRPFHIPDYIIEAHGKNLKAKSNMKYTDSAELQWPDKDGHYWNYNFATEKTSKGLKRKTQKSIWFEPKT